MSRFSHLSLYCACKLSIKRRQCTENMQNVQNISRLVHVFVYCCVILIHNYLLRHPGVSISGRSQLHHQHQGQKLSFVAANALQSAVEPSFCQCWSQRLYHIHIFLKNKKQCHMNINSMSRWTLNKFTNRIKLGARWWKLYFDTTWLERCGASLWCKRISHESFFFVILVLQLWICWTRCWLSTLTNGLKWKRLWHILTWNNIMTLQMRSDTRMFGFMSSSMSLFEMTMHHI